MTISSRTPEGLPNRCPICRKNVMIEVSLLFGDATCPNCGSLLWYLRTASSPRFYPYDQAEGIRNRVAEFIAEQLGVERSKVTGDLSIVKSELGADSLDAVELVMELEEEFDGWE